MSMRASLISFFLRRTVKKTMSNFVDPISVRARFSSSPKKLSAKVKSERLDAGGVPGSWLSKKNADVPLRLFCICMEEVTSSVATEATVKSRLKWRVL